VGIDGVWGTLGDSWESNGGAKGSEYHVNLEEALGQVTGKRVWFQKGKIYHYDGTTVERTCALMRVHQDADSAKTITAVPVRLQIPAILRDRYIRSPDSLYLFVAGAGKPDRTQPYVPKLK